MQPAQQRVHRQFLRTIGGIAFKPCPLIRFGGTVGPFPYESGVVSLFKLVRAEIVQQVQTVTEQELIDEWAREFYLEGRRRSDLVRFGMFTTNKYLWDWKGGAMNGTSVASYYNKYPIPVSDINNNRNMSQNEGYK